MPTPRHLRAHVWAAVAYLAVAVAFSWPLATHLGTALTGPPSGDTGVYVWNQWVFQQELLHRHLPWFTDAIFGHNRIANLSLHNYTTFQNLLALPLIGWLGGVATFNIVYLFTIVLTAYCAFLLALRVTDAPAESWLAGLLFAWSPFMITRGMGHFSLVAGAPLAIFLLLLEGAAARPRLRHAVALGATVWWASSTDAYYAVYCLLLGGVFLATRVLVVERDPIRMRPRAVRWGIDVLMLSLAGVIAAILVTGGWRLTLLGIPLRMQTLYTPVLALTVLALARIAWRYRATFQRITAGDVWTVARLASAAAVVAAILLLPRLYAVGVRIAQGRGDTPRTLWRSSPPGVDALALVLPNPNHPLVPAAIREWLTGRPNGYLENVASIPWIAIAVLAFAWWRGWRASRWWAGLAAFFGLLALGPFVNIAGMNTHVPGPWALLRYVPLVGLARTPARFVVLLVLAIAVMTAAALKWIGEQHPGQRRTVVAVVAFLMLFELLPAPVRLYSAAIPGLYQRIATDPRDIAVLELPFGIRDGASSVGDFSALTQYFQTAHGKTIMGGYLSTVSRRRVEEMRRIPTAAALLLLSENRPLTPEQDAAFRADARGFIAREQIGYVVMDRTRATPALARATIDAFALTLVERDGPLELYRPAVH